MNTAEQTFQEDLERTAEQTHQEDLERVKSFRYMDDDFMTACLDDNIEGVELIVRIVLGRDDINIKSVRTQAVMKNLQGRSCRLDAHAVDAEKKEYDFEIQRSDEGAGAKRARHNSSLLDAHILKPGQDTDEIPDSYVIFITENDVLEGDQPVYLIDRYVTIGENKVLFGDGSHIVYVNGKYRGDDAVGRLMHDFSCTNPDDMNYEALAKKARFFKQDEKGVARMCKMLEDMRNETAKQAAKEATIKNSKKTAANLLRIGKMSLEEIAEATELPLKDVEALKAN